MFASRPISQPNDSEIYSKPQIVQKWFNNWTPMSGHGCQTIDEMKSWVDARNQRAGKTFFKIIGLPQPDKKEPKKKTVVEPINIEERPLTNTELQIAKRTLGLDEHKKACRNRLVPLPSEIEPINGMVGAGLMRDLKGVFCLTAQGLDRLTSIQPISWGVVQ